MTLFASADDAAIAALDLANPVAIRECREYGGLIYRQAPGRYGHTPPLAGNHDHFDLSRIRNPRRTTVVGNYHCHGAYTTFLNGRHVRTDREGADMSARGFGILGPDADTFSRDDEVVFRRHGRGVRNYSAYLGTASRVYLVWRFGTRHPVVLARRVPRLSR